MRKFIYQIHLILGVLVAIPVLGWATSGFLYTLPNAVEDSTIEKIDASKVKITPADAIERANQLAARQLPTTALTLLMKEGRPQYQSVGGLGADSIFIDAETGSTSFSAPPSLRTQFFRQAHFYFFAGRWQITLLTLFSLLAAISAITGIYLNISYWSRRILGR